MKTRSVILALVVIAAGALWIAYIFGLFNIEWMGDIHLGKIIIPGLLVLVGLNMLIYALFPKYHSSKREWKSIQPTKDCQVSFSARNVNYEGQCFDGVNVNIYFGGARIDLRKSDIKDGSRINVHAMFGGVEIFLPEDINVEISSNCFVGGVDDNRTKSTTTQTKTIYIDANCTFGGVAIK
ncbi:MAG: hypothetical protein J6X92_00595 [Bacteroidales bacterium]|nr:hypothetical protein [Bacteroidales bacterium]